MQRAAAAYSKLGEHGAVWLALGASGAALDARRRDRWGRAVATVVGAYALNVGLKWVVRRPRPRLEDLPQLTGTPTQLSFPSSHATSGFAAARAYSALLPAPPLYALAGSLALSRLFLGVHWPSDIAAGAMLGTVVGSAGRGRAVRGGGR